MSKKVLKEGILAAGNIAGDHRAEFIASVVGVFGSDNPNDDTIISKDVVHIDSDKVMSMSDEERLELYNKILSSVGVNESA